MLLVGLWILLAVAYAAPLWLTPLVSIDFVFIVDPSAPTWLSPVILGVAYALPPSILAAFTWWWLRRRNPA